MGMGSGMDDDPRSGSNAESTTLATLHVTGDEGHTAAACCRTDSPAGPPRGTNLSTAPTHPGHGDGHGWSGMSFTIDGNGVRSRTGRPDRPERHDRGVDDHKHLADGSPDPPSCVADAGHRGTRS